MQSALLIGDCFVPRKDVHGVLPTPHWSKFSTSTQNVTSILLVLLFDIVFGCNLRIHFHVFILVPAAVKNGFLVI